MFFSGTESKPAPFRWLGTKTELYELLVALDLYGAIGDVSQHKAPFTDLVKHAGDLFNLSVSDASTIKGNILERKTKRTTFIDALRASLKSDGFGRG